jgi:hypothetical protein
VSIDVHCQAVKNPKAQPDEPFQYKLTYYLDDEVKKVDLIPDYFCERYLQDPS